LNYDIYVRAFTSYVLPILEYECVKWSARLIKDINIVESVQRKFTKRVFYRCNLRPQDYRSRIDFQGLQTLEFRRAMHDLLTIHSLVYEKNDRFPNFFSFVNTNSGGHNSNLECLTTE